MMKENALQLALLAKAREKLVQEIRFRAPSSLVESDSTVASDVEIEAAAFVATRAKLPGATPAKPTTLARTMLEAAAYIRGIDTHPTEADEHLALRILHTFDNAIHTAALVCALEPTP